MARERQRTRSPMRTTAKTAWISKSVCVFGRYPEKRPPGLNLLPDGGLLLSELMDVWGQKQGLTAANVLQAIRAHMFHDGTPGTLRFSIDCNDEKEMIIRVMPPKVSNKLQDCARPQQAQQEQQQQQQQQEQRCRKGGPIRIQGVQGRGSILCQLPLGVSGAASAASSVQHTPQLSLGRGSILCEFPRDERSADKRLGASASSPPNPVESNTRQDRQLQEKLAMPLDALVHDATRAPASEAAVFCASAGNDSVPVEERAERRKIRNTVNRAFSGKESTKVSPASSQIDLTDAFSQIDLTQDANQSQPAPDSCESVPGKDGDVAMIDGSGPEARARPQLPRVPCRPPGEHWTQYKDEDDHDLWWHYEGPLGKWWTTHLSKDPPQPYIEN